MSVSGNWILLNHSWPWLLASGCVLALALWSGWTSSSGRGRRIRALLISVRILAALAVIAAILQPALETDLVRAKRPPLAVVVDDSKSMALGEQPPGETVSRWLKDNSEKLAALDKVFRVEYYRPGPSSAEVGKLPADLPDYATDRTPLGRTLEEITRLRPEVEAMILLSDGRDTERPAAPPALGVPVYPVVSGAPPAKDIWIEALEAPPVGFVRTPVEVRVRLGRMGFPEGPAQLTLLEDGLPLKTEVVKPGEGGVGTLSFTPVRTGRKAYRVELAPRLGEASQDNNAAQFTINVIRDKTRVLLVSGTPTWDVKAIRRRLARDPSIDLITFMILRTPTDTNNVDQSELSLIPFPTEELFNKELPSFDAVVMVNFDYSPYVPTSYLANMVRFVKDAGGGLVMVGGDRSFGLGGYDATPLAEILPVDMSGAAPGRLFGPVPFKPRPTAEGESHPVTRLSESGDRTERLYQSLPELNGLNWALKPRPGATVLLEAPQVRNEHGNAPVIVVNEVGAGRVMAITTDTLWKWSMPYSASGGEEVFYRDFWTRSLRWLVHDPDMELVRLAQPPELRAEAEAVFGARVLGRDYKPAAGAKLTGELVGEGGKTQKIEWLEAAPGEYRSLPVKLGRQGLYRLKVEGFSQGLLLGRDEAGISVEPPSPEPLRIGVDSSYLAKLAATSGGKVYLASDAELIKMLEKRGAAKVETIGKRIDYPFTNWLALTLLIALLGLDWALRRILE